MIWIDQGKTLLCNTIYMIMIYGTRIRNASLLFIYFLFSIVHPKNGVYLSYVLLYLNAAVHLSGTNRPRTGARGIQGMGGYLAHGFTLT